MRYDAEPAYVLHTRPWRESSLLVEVLSANHGRLGLLARGVQGPKRHVLRAALQPMQFIRTQRIEGAIDEANAPAAVVPALNVLDRRLSWHDLAQRPALR
mgnify:CR=1 FL=1